MKKSIIAITLLVFFYGMAYADEIRGAQLYEQHCGRCHNFRPPSERSDREWSIVIAHMRSSAMLTDQQSKDILKFLQANNNPVLDTKHNNGKHEVAAFSKENGEILVAKNACLGCHSFAGTGGKVGPSLDGLFVRRSAEFVKQQLTNPKAHNVASIMPAYDFSEDELMSIIEYLKSAK